MPGIDYFQITSITVTIVGAGLAVIDFMDWTRNLEKLLQQKITGMQTWLSNNPIAIYLSENFKVTIQYVLGILGGGFLFVFLFVALEGDFATSVFGALLLILVAGGSLNARFKYSAAFAVIFTVAMKSSNPDFPIEPLYLFSLVLVIATIHLIGVIAMAHVYYLSLYLLHKIFDLLSRPKKGIVGSISLIVSLSGVAMLVY